MYTFLIILLLMILIAVVSYMLNIHKTTIINSKNSSDKRQLKILTYNIQRLPHLLRPNIDILDIYNKTGADIICLQEDFRLLYTNYEKYKEYYNVFHIGNTQIYSIADSGLTVYSKLKAKDVYFVTFESSLGVDSLAQKGFLVIVFNDFILVNTHMQSYGETVQTKQKEQIYKHLSERYSNQKIFITGDFNIDLREVRLNGYKTIIPTQPTYIEINKKCENVYYFLDGAFVKDILVVNITECIYDKYADHLGVLMDIIV